MEALNDNDTWTRISLAALRVLTQIEKPKEKIASEHHQAGEGENDSDRDRKGDARNPIVVSERKRSA